jgi:hypothetical protein
LQCLDLGIGVPGQVVEEALAVDLGQLDPDAALLVHHQGPDTADDPNGLPRSQFHPLQQVLNGCRQSGSIEEGPTAEAAACCPIRKFYFLAFGLD